MSERRVVMGLVVLLCVSPAAAAPDSLRPIALASADLDVDGYPDLVSGYGNGDPRVSEGQPGGVRS
jgi:hypothetical protein